MYANNGIVIFIGRKNTGVTMIVSITPAKTKLTIKYGWFLIPEKNSEEVIYPS